MLRKFMIITFICSLSAMLISACAAVAPGSSGSPQADIGAEAAYNAVESTELTAPGETAGEISISITAPEGWVKNDETSELLYYEKGLAFISVVAPWIPKDAKSAMDVAAYECGQIKGSFQEAEVSDPVEATLDGSNAARVELNIAISADSTQKQVYVYFFKNGTAYKVMASYSTNNGQDAADIESILQSMKIQ